MPGCDWATALYFTGKVFGLDSVIDNMIKKIAETESESSKKYYIGMKSALEGIRNYSQSLYEEAKRQNLEEIAYVLSQVPNQPPRNFREAISAIWIIWVWFRHFRVGIFLQCLQFLE